MSKTCARCEKTVYPIEELKCLDKIWHKGCFKCQGCGMTLNMRTYKGFNKQPYCEAHIPKVKATTMAETPELKRIAENTKIQSNVKYHADFEKSKGKFTQVADDPETLRIKQNSKIISNVAYHGELEKKAAMEQKRTLNENGDYVVEDEASMHLKSSSINNNANNTTTTTTANIHYSTSSSNQSSSQYPSTTTTTSTYTHTQHHLNSNSNNNHHHHPQTMFIQHEQSTIANQQAGYANNVPTSAYHHHQQHHHNYSSSGITAAASTAAAPATATNVAAHHYSHTQLPNHQNNASIGKISDYDPLSDQPRNSPYTARQSATVIYTSNQGAVTNPPQRRIGSVSDLDPVNNVYGSLSNEYRNSGVNANHQNQTTQQYGNHNLQQQHSITNQQTQNLNNATGRVYRALYDYEAQDSDEVSFLDGDLIIQAASVDAGWMTGTVQRTGRTGMLPANYVERVVI